MQVSLFTDGRRLYEAGQQQPFDLVFLDIEMPERDGSGWQSSWALAVRRPGLYLFPVMRAGCLMPTNICPCGL